MPAGSRIIDLHTRYDAQVPLGFDPFTTALTRNHDRNNGQLRASALCRRYHQSAANR